MKKKRIISVKKSAGILLTLVLGISQIMPYGSRMAMAAEADNTDSGIVDEETSEELFWNAGDEDASSAGDVVTSEYNLEDGTYVPGEILVCVMPGIAAAYNESADSDVWMSETGIEPLGAGSLLEMGEDLMDVTEIVHDEILSGDDEYIPVSDTGSDRVDADVALEESAVIRFIHSDEYTTEELLAMYSDHPGVIYAEPNYIYNISDEYPAAAADPEEADAASTVAAEADEYPVATSEAEDTIPAEYSDVEEYVSYPDLTSLQYAYGDSPAGMDVPGWNDPDNINATGVIAVMDTGVDHTHPDIAPVMWDEGEKYKELTDLGGGKYGINTNVPKGSPESTDTTDIHSHGTHIAGIIAGAWNGFGISGIANGAKIMAVRSANDQGAFPTSSFIKGFDYVITAKGLGVDVISINCSYAGSFSSGSEYLAIKKAETAGIITVKATGNESLNADLTNLDPAIVSVNPAMIAVDASDRSGESAGFTNYGLRSSHIYSPGEKIMSTIPVYMDKGSDDPEFVRPIRDEDGHEVIDIYDGREVYFERMDNPYSPAKIESYGGALMITVPKLTDLEQDSITAETTGGTDIATVVFSLKPKASLPPPKDGTKYTLYVSSSGDPDIFLKVYVKTTDGTWERPGLTMSMSPYYQVDQYVLDTGLNGGTFDLEDLNIRITISDSQEVIEEEHVSFIDRIWISDVPAVPYNYFNGTSMATPAVAGETAILAKAFPGESAAKRASRVLAGVRHVDGLKDRCITGGMANVKGSLDENFYTPVITGFEHDTDSMSVTGYFFGTKEDTVVTLMQGDKTWVSGDGSFGITGIEGIDPEKIIMTLPKDIIPGEVMISVTDKAKAAGRDTYSRMFVYSKPDGFDRLSCPEGIEDFYNSAIFGLNDKIYFVGEYGQDEIPVTYVYDPGKDSWDKALYPAPSGMQQSVTVWNGQLAQICLWGVAACISFWEPDKGVTGSYYINTGEYFDKKDRLGLYYDGEDMIMLRTPMEEYEDGLTIPKGSTEVWKVDCDLLSASKIGELNGAYRTYIITHSEKKEADKTIRTIYVTGENFFNYEKNLTAESFVIPAADEAFISQSRDITPEGGIISLDRKKCVEFSGCGTKDGLFITGIVKADTDDETGRADILADNFNWNYSSDGVLVPETDRMSYGRVASTLVTAYKGKVYIAGYTKDQKGDKLNAIFTKDMDTLPAYGDQLLPDTDTSVRVKKLTLSDRSIRINRGQTASISAENIFTDTTKTTFPVYESSNRIVCRVDRYSGEILAGELGSAVITVRCGDKTARCTVKVEDTGFEPLGLNKTKTELKTGEMDRLLIADCYLTGSETVKWVSEDPKIVSVKDGLITAKAEGKTNVKAIWKSGKRTKTYECNVKVTGIDIPKAQAADKAAKLSTGKASVKMNSGDNTTVSINLSGADHAGRTVIVRTSNPDIFTLGGSEESLTLVTKASVGKKNRSEASFDIYAQKAGTAYAIVESFAGTPETKTDDTPVNMKLVKVSVDSPVKALGWCGDAFMYGTAEGIPEHALPNNNITLCLNKGCIDAQVFSMYPEVYTGSSKIKCSVKGSGVSVKNGVITAKSVSKKNKDGLYQPATLTFKCGNATLLLDVYVVE